MINPTPNIASLNPAIQPQTINTVATDKSTAFRNTVDTIKQQISKVNDLQKEADQSITDLLTGKNDDITSVVSAVAKADMSFKLLVGVRNKLIEAYKQTMQMGI
jgi:flagellar hook-basal body complex protein FliE